MKLSIQYNKKIDSEKKLKKLVYFAYNLNKKFFKKELLSLQIKFFYTRKNFDVYFKKIYNQLSLSWIVAWIPHQRYIHIFSPSVFSIETSHNKKNFIKVLTHEIAHIFIKELYHINEPRWLIEGLADFIAEKDFKNIKLKTVVNFKDLHTFEDFHKSNSYNQSGLFIKYLLENFDQDTLLKLLSSLNNNGGKNDFNDFKKIFKTIYKINFNAVVKNWWDKK